MSGFTPNPNITITASSLPTNAAQEVGNLSQLNSKIDNQITLADGYANTDATIIGSFLIGYNGTTWDRVRTGVTANTTSVTGVLNTIPTARFNASPVFRTEGQFGSLQSDGYGYLKSTLTDPSGLTLFPIAAAASDTGDPTELVTAIKARLSAYSDTTGKYSRIRQGIITIGSSVTGYVNTLGMAVYNSSPTLRTDGYNGPTQADLYGNIKVAEAYSPNYEDNTNSVATTALKYLPNGAYSPSLLVSDYGATITKNAKALAGTLTQCIAKSRNVGIVWLQFHNTATTPSAAAVPALSIEFSPGEQKIIGAELLSLNGFKFTTGIAYAWSTTSGTYTAGTAANQDIQVFGV